ncbi:MAG: conjugal transfer protein TraR [Sulfurimonas sp.]|nr:conjugal transfer protein TraR [Sulfurimonas sp.]MBU3939274.1 TraR/DksA C4-type zinc finger protein [bacterium]MBU4024127.1 TraR/DksA C4-type zinc finger protein [bacterium]MBU4110830.1 TraR/DksA C4-type zinc finger protein [bacterium]
MLTRKDLNLEDFKTLLEAEKEKINQNAEMLAIEADTLAGDDQIGDLADATELQIDSMTDRVILSQLRAELLEIDAALGRIKSGSYGICEKTGKPIPKERLLANPVARTVVNI